MLSSIEIQLYRELFRKSFYEFYKYFWSSVNPEKFVDGKLMQFYCETFQYMCRPWVEYTPVQVDIPERTDDIDIIDVREDKNKLCINIPPRHSKSQVFNVFGPVWLWSFHHIKAVAVSHTAGLSTDMNMKRQKLINSEKYMEIFGKPELKVNSTTSIIDNEGGELYSINRNSFTGYGGDMIINDDLTNAETARKDKEEMNNAWSYYRNTMPSRINDPNKSVIMNIQQRLAPNDITGHILNDSKLASQYIFIVLKAILPKNTYLICPISGDVYFFEKGSGLWDERFSLKDYESLRYSVGEAVFETQYLQNPIASEKTIIKDDMIIEKDETECPTIDQANMIFASHDFPVKDKETSDYLGSVLAYRVGQTLYIKDCLEAHMAFVKSIQYVEQLDLIYPGIIQVIEDKANGSPILQQLKEQISGMQPFQPGSNSKSQRLESASLYMSSGNVIFVRTVKDKETLQYRLSEKLQNLKNRLLNFPFVEHDDIVDALSMLVLFVFMDRKNSVYGRSFSELNVIDVSEVTNIKFSEVFFNKEGDNWKVLEIGVKYGETSKLYIMRELAFKANVEQGIAKLKEFAPDKKIFMECSSSEALYGLYKDKIMIENYCDEDFDKSTNNLSMNFAYKNVLVDKHCKLCQMDIENIKYDKSKNDNVVRYKTEKDGFVGCIRSAIKYFGGL